MSMDSRNPRALARGAVKTRCEEWSGRPAYSEMAWASKSRKEAEATLRNALFCGDMFGPAPSPDSQQVGAAFARLFLAWNGIKP